MRYPEVIKWIMTSLKVVIDCSLRIVLDMVIEIKAIGGATPLKAVRCTFPVAFRYVA